MNWPKIKKSKTPNVPASVSDYKAYKSYLRTESDEKCVYCAIKEAYLGGSDSFHVEHFKPKSNPRFKHLELVYSNLFYACAICNRFKGKDWPNDSDPLKPSYLDPNHIDYNTVFTVTSSCLVEGSNVASKYMIEKIYLNRVQLQNQRLQEICHEKKEHVMRNINEHFKKLLTLKGDSKADEYLQRLFSVVTKISLHLNKEPRISKYLPNETKRK